MKPAFERPAMLVCQVDEKSLSNQGMVELMTATLAKGKPFRFRAEGGSMDPFIQSGDVLTFELLTQKPGPGRVVAFLNPTGGKLTVHRVVGAGREGFLMRGDALADFDGWVRFDQMIGLVVSSQRGGKPVRLGLGPERWLIAFLSRRGWLLPLRFNPFLQRLRRMVKP